MGPSDILWKVTMICLDMSKLVSWVYHSTFLSKMDVWLWVHGKAFTSTNIGAWRGSGAPRWNRKLAETSHVGFVVVFSHPPCAFVPAAGIKEGGVVDTPVTSSSPSKGKGKHQRESSFSFNRSLARSLDLSFSRCYRRSVERKMPSSFQRL